MHSSINAAKSFALVVNRFVLTGGRNLRDLGALHSIRSQFWDELTPEPGKLHIVES
jgi:hypothetical protein